MVREEARGKRRGRERTGHGDLCYTPSPGLCSPKQTDRGNQTLGVRVTVGWAVEPALWLNLRIKYLGNGTDLQASGYGVCS